VHGLGRARPAVLKQRPALPRDLDQQVRRALDEDVGSGDLTAALVPVEQRARATVVAREACVLCGSAWFDAVFAASAPPKGGRSSVTVEWFHHDGDRVAAGATLCELEGPARALLTGERSALNFLQTLSGTATTAQRYAEALQGTRCRVLDTRKTLPGLRSAQKYAVAVGGGSNHRMGLYDAILIKENHIAAAGSIAAAVASARRLSPGVKVEVEVENQGELDQALAAGADMALLDDFPLAELATAVRRVAGRIPLEASGGVAFEGLRAIAETGVDFVSVGALTKHLHAVDLSMRFD
jgi:nicotinate-nucleotide pyrophosphorylase (carboxylating)